MTPVNGLGWIDSRATSLAGEDHGSPSIRPLVIMSEVVDEVSDVGDVRGGTNVGILPALPSGSSDTISRRDLISSASNVARVASTSAQTKPHTQPHRRLDVKSWRPSRKLDVNGCSSAQVFRDLFDPRS